MPRLRNPFREKGARQLTPSINPLSLWLFIGSAAALLGSPGPGIASLLAVGRSVGFAKSLRYFWGLQAGLAVAAGLCAAGLFSLLRLIPGAVQMLSMVAALYLIQLAYRIASAPIGAAAGADRVRPSFSAGLLLGFANPKAFLAFLALFASQTLLAGNQRADNLVKWLLVIAVMIAVDLIWLLIGASLRRATLRPRTERILNIVLGGLVAAAMLSTLL